MKLEIASYPTATNSVFLIFNRSNKNHGIKKVFFSEMALKSDKLLFICYGMEVQKGKSQEEGDGYIFFFLGN